ncbi:hypothetical protein [Alteraurantiacibacter aquimixticola]|uniref:Uncharacterized protein n=1 Tax=Alteraurantiacibacter aquimixticola TaxID=2489173 RepID=A0A4T3EZQ9_9SPHN|nr:hypothetical protein [Alteraurantiacibacter aquimixticola]TIX49634.1 hypothetical protein E5222_12450 [Alteraurantiacibacter aquimixticola]
MEIEIGEVSSDVTAIDLAALKAELVDQIMRQIAEDRRLQDRIDSDRRLRNSATNRPEDLV